METIMPHGFRPAPSVGSGREAEELGRDGVGQPDPVGADVEDVPGPVHGARVDAQDDRPAPAGADPGRGLPVGERCTWWRAMGRSPSARIAESRSATVPW